jgi:stage III sporulation protein AH
MSNNKKKIIILCTMVVLLVAAGYLNYTLNIGPPPDDLGRQTFLQSHKIDREVQRKDEIAYLDAIIHNPATSSAARAAAEADRLEVVRNMQLEFHLEQTIKSKGFEDAVVLANGSNISVVVLGNNLTNAQMAQIYDVILSQTTFAARDITIIPYSV